jgi:DNA-binding transcriptional LysR family regulator
MDVDTRLLRYFAAVAAEGNLSRAATRLFMSQPALTKQIKQLENRLGVQLFTRSRAGMTLTSAGQALANTTPAVLASWDQALRETKTAARAAARVLRVGFMSSAANEATQQIIAAFTRRRPDWKVEMQQAAWSDPTAGLASGDADVALLRLPFPGQNDMRIEVLLTEPRWVALPSTHPLAVRDEVSFDQLWDEPFIAAPAETGLWRDYWLATDERQGHPVRIGTVTDQPDAFLIAIANGDGVALAPESAARYYTRPGITYRPVTGIGPSQVAVAWAPLNDTNPLVQDFVSCCLDNKPLQHPTSPPDEKYPPSPSQADRNHGLPSLG